MSKPGKGSADLRFFLFVLAAGAMDYPLLSVALGQGPVVSPAAALGLHAASAALAFLAPPRERGFLRPTRHWGEALGLLALLLPGVGWLLGACLVAAHRHAAHAKDAYRFDDEAEEDTNPLAAAGSAAAIKKELADALDVVPAADALLGQDPALKRGAIEALAKIRTPEAIAWIVRARVDADPEVRFYATSALTQLKRDFETLIRAAEREAFRRPGDLGPQIAVHSVRYEYARSGLVEAAARASILDECLTWLAEHADRDVEALRLLYLIERQRAPDRALQSLARLIDAEPHRRHAWARERVMLLFDLGLHGDVRLAMRQLGPELLAEPAAPGDPVETEWRSAALWWNDGAPA